MSELVSKWHNKSRIKINTDIHGAIDIQYIIEIGDKMADLIEKQDRLLGLYRSQTAEAIAILENGTKYEKMHLVGILNVAIKQEETL